MRLAISEVQGAAAPRPGGVEAAGGLLAEVDAVPVLPSTLLGLELLAQRPAFDLRAAARLVRDDPGAVLAVFGARAEECTEGVARAVRLEECLASLSREHLLRALSGARCCRRSQVRFAVFVRHAVAVGRSAETVAAALGLPAEVARLVGLLHELGHAPELLGWSGWPPDAARCCDRLARAHGLPATLRQALDEVHGEQPGSVWGAVVRAAHELLPLDPGRVVG